MGQKVHPLGLRLGVIKDWASRWYSKKNYSELLHEDLEIRKFIKGRLYAAGISRVEIERAANRVRLTIHTARPGMVIGKGGQEVESLRRQLESLTGKQVSVNIVEVRIPELDAQLVAENIAQQIEKRISFRRAMKQALARAMKLGAQGVKMSCSGRLGGAEIARSEGYNEGKVPLHTLRADIDYGFAEAYTTYGRIGVKVWIYKGEVLPEKPKAAAQGGE
ncbi:MAG: 30S ribosomal protein S3 [Firmicutes bacterium]|nr:30S ribosomal protein S3 [Bacillota bacterium]